MNGSIYTAVDTFRAWRRRVRERALLGSLSDRTLKDIGLSRADANMEADKPFWRA